MHSAANSFSREVTRHYDSYFNEFNLTTSYVELLLILFQEVEISQNELAEAMMLAPSTITRFINKLDKKGLVEKRRVGRSARISLSKEGKELLPSLERKFKAAEKDLKGILGDKYVHTTKGLLEHGAKLLQEEE